jgi:hypothetical protein
VRKWVVMSSALFPPRKSVSWAYSAKLPRPPRVVVGPALQLRGFVHDRTPLNTRLLHEQHAFLKAATRVVPGFTDLFTGESLTAKWLPVRHDIYLFGFIKLGRGSLFSPTYLDVIEEHLHLNGPMIRVMVNHPIAANSKAATRQRAATVRGGGRRVSNILRPQGLESTPTVDFASFNTEAGKPIWLEVTTPESFSVREYFFNLAAASNWARQFNVVADFAVFAALRALADKTANIPSSARFLAALERIRRKDIERCNSRLMNAFYDPQRDPSFLGSWPTNLDLTTWNPYLEPETDFKRRYDKILALACSQAILQRDRSVSAIKCALDRSGEDPLPRKRKRGNTVPEMRYEWAALRQCSGKTIAEIADLSQEDSEVVRRATNRILDELGFRTHTWAPWAVLEPSGPWGQ